MRRGWGEHVGGAQMTTPPKTEFLSSLSVMVDFFNANFSQIRVNRVGEPQPKIAPIALTVVGRLSQRENGTFWSGLRDKRTEMSKGRLFTFRTLELHF